MEKLIMVLVGIVFTVLMFCIITAIAPAAIYFLWVYCEIGIYFLGADANPHLIKPNFLYLWGGWIIISLLFGSLRR